MLRIKLQLLLFLYFILFQVKCQNLVPNPSFENLNRSAPCDIIQSKVEFSSYLQNWTIPNDGTSDIYSTLVPATCTANCLSSIQGSQAPRTGEIMCAFILYGIHYSSIYSYREYIQTQLTSPLIIEKKYYAEMYVSLADFVKYGCNNIGMAFSTTQITEPNDGVISFTPQVKSSAIITDTINWVKISGIFTATKAAKYLTIGNFNDDTSTAATILNNNYRLNTAYYYIDDILLEEFCNPHDSISSICKGNSITLDLNDRHITHWSLASTPNTILSNSETLVVSPQVTTRYMAHYDCNETAIFEVIVDSHPTFNLGNDTTLCKGQKIDFDATTEHATYLWQDGSTKPNYSVSKTGQYSVEITNGCGRFQSNVLITVNKPSRFSFGSDTTICIGEMILFNATTDGAKYVWQDGSTNPIHFANDTGYYTVTIQNVCGTLSDSIMLKSCCNGAIIPNLITPNGDGLNDVFNVGCYGNGDYELTIYNEWGADVYQSNAYQNNWGGKNISDGIYYFIITYKGKLIYKSWVQVLK